MKTDQAYLKWAKDWVNPKRQFACVAEAVNQPSDKSTPITTPRWSGGSTILLLIQLENRAYPTEDAKFLPQTTKSVIPTFFATVTLSFVLELEALLTTKLLLKLLVFLSWGHNLFKFFMCNKIINLPLNMDIPSNMREEGPSSTLFIGFLQP